MDSEAKRYREQQKDMTFKQKLAHYWYYYKIHAIAGILIITVAAFTIADIVNRVPADLTVGLYVNGYIPDEYTQTLKERISACISSEGEQRPVEISSMTYDLSLNDEMSIALRQRYIAELAAGECMLYVLDEAYLEDFTANELIDTYAPLAGEEPSLYVVLPILRENQAKKPKKVLEREAAEQAYSGLTE